MLFWWKFKSVHVVNRAIFVGVICVAGGEHAWRGACVVGGVHGGGHAWQGSCMVGGHAWQGCVCGGGHAWQGACMPHMPPDTTRYGRSMRGRYASYWNAFLSPFYLTKNASTLWNFYFSPVNVSVLSISRYVAWKIRQMIFFTKYCSRTLKTNGTDVLTQLLCRTCCETGWIFAALRRLSPWERRSSPLF